MGIRPRGCQKYPLSSPPSYFAGWVIVAFIISTTTTPKKKLSGISVLLSVRCFTCSRSCSREQIGCSLSSEHPGSSGEFRHHSGTFQKLQETGSGLQLSLSAALQQLPSAVVFAASALALVLGPATPTCRGPDGLSSPPSRGLPVPGAAAGRLAAEKPGSSVS